MHKCKTSNAIFTHHNFLTAAPTLTCNSNKLRLIKVRNTLHTNHHRGQNMQQGPVDHSCHKEFCTKPSQTQTHVTKTIYTAESTCSVSCDGGPLQCVMRRWSTAVCHVTVVHCSVSCDGGPLQCVMRRWSTAACHVTVVHCSVSCDGGPLQCVMRRWSTATCHVTVVHCSVSCTTAVCHATVVHHCVSCDGGPLLQCLLVQVHQQL